MAKKYLLPCECGREIPVETAQAGEETVCDCGKTLAVPRLLELKRLPSADEGETPEAALSGDGRAIHLALIIGGAFFFLVFSALLAMKLGNPPTQRDAANLRSAFSYEGNIVQSSANPISQEEWRGALTTDEHIDMMPPAHAVQYFHELKQGVQPSFGMRSRYKQLIVVHNLWLGTLGALAFIALVIAVSAALARPRKTP